MLKTACLLVLCLFGSAAQAWNKTGHIVIAYIAYSNLDPAPRRRVHALLRKHPDYAKWVEGLPASERGRAAFLAAANWPDRMRYDPRFFDDGAEATPLLPGFPDMQRHASWHYIDIPFSTDGTPFPKEIRAPNALTQIELFLKSIGNRSIEESLQAYELAWLVHLVADVHQPLHCVSRFTRTQFDPQTKAFFADQGGNLVHIYPETNLHAYWDGLLGNGETADAISVATSLMRSEKLRNPAPPDPGAWIEEGFQIAKRSVYSFEDRSRIGEQIVLAPGYRPMAENIARKQAALAGYRLAAVLNRVLAN